MGGIGQLKQYYYYYSPTKEQAKEWQGWKTPALKPAFEPIVVAQKPCEGSITENVMKYGVGGFNIDECRIAYEDKEDASSSSSAFKAFSNNKDARDAALFPIGAEFERDISEKGRYPSNVMMTEPCYGGFSKFFLIPKASASEKNENLDDIEEQENLQGLDTRGRTLVREDGSKTLVERFKSKAKCTHPTVKPISLMKHLIKLTTKPKYTVLDPFLGSGTTGIAALNLNRNFIGIEKSEDYMKIAKARIREEAMQTRLI